MGSDNSYTHSSQLKDELPVAETIYGVSIIPNNETKVTYPRGSRILDLRDASMHLAYDALTSVTYAELQNVLIALEAEKIRISLWTFQNTISNLKKGEASGLKKLIYCIEMLKRQPGWSEKDKNLILLNIIYATSVPRDKSAFNLLFELMGNRDVSIQESALSQLKYLFHNDFGTQKELWLSWFHENGSYLYWVESILNDRCFAIDQEAKTAGIPTDEYRKTHPWPKDNKTPNEPDKNKPVDGK